MQENKTNLATYHIPSRSFFNQNPEVVAQHLLGALLRMRLSTGEYVGGRIVEVECYLAEGDPAAHHVTRGRTETTEAKFQAGGALYIHRIHRHTCLDIVVGAKSIPDSILIRALEPTEGLARMHENRNTKDRKNLTNGPGKLCEALRITQSMNGQYLQSADCPIELRVLNDPVPPQAIERSTRIGIKNGTHLPLRFFIRGNASVSRRTVTPPDGNKNTHQH